MATQKTNRDRSRKVPCSFLVASPYAAHTGYQRSVVLLVRSDNRGATGIVLDSQFRKSFREFQQRLDDAESAMPMAQDMKLRVINWSAQELLEELEHGVWLTTPARREDLVGTDDLWVSLVRRVGRSVLQDSLAINQFPEDASTN